MGYRHVNDLLRTGESHFPERFSHFIEYSAKMTELVTFSNLSEDVALYRICHFS
jgi:hypothetical protein